MRRCGTFCHYRINGDVLQNSSVFTDSNVEAVESTNEKRPFNAFVKACAYLIRHQLFNRVQTESSERKLVAIHLRAYDRPCLIQNLKPAQLLERIQFFNITKKNSVIYLMTDADRNSPHVRILHDFFQPFFMTTSDVRLFKEVWFRKDGAIVFAIELEIQNLADYVVESYRNHAMSKFRDVGILVPDECKDVDPIGITSRA